MTNRVEPKLCVCVFLVAWCTACTPVSQPGGSVRAEPRDGGADGSFEADASAGKGGIQTGEGSAAERCDREGELRCTAGGRRRERCMDGRFREADACAEGEVCAATGARAGSCIAVVDACRGSAASTVCDATGTMYRCGEQGMVDSSQRCESARHCQLGLDAGSCAACLPGEFRCSGDLLEVCNAAGSGFEMEEACLAGACDASAGICRGAACPEQRAICRGDVLEICAPGAMEFDEVARCEPGLCNAAAARCDACVPGTRSCEGETSVSCAEDGGERTRRDCAGDLLHCVGRGQCVECSRDADCASPSPCRTAYCDLVSGECKSQPRPLRSVCPAGLCSADGECSACLADADCPAVGPCEIRSCDAETHQCAPAPAPQGTRCGGGVCDGRGACVGCVDDDACPAVGPCQVRSCNASTKICEPRAAPDGQDCGGTFGAGTCSSGQCVECRVDGDCGRATACEEAFCRSSDNTCQRRPAPPGAACERGRVCDGAGECVECSADLHCGANAACVDNSCRCNPGYAENPNGDGCNFDECANFDDNRCGADPATGNTCTNTVDGYDCGCRAPWKLGNDQCFRGGTSSDVRTVRNGSSWNVVPEFGVVCDNAFDANAPCIAGQLTWLNVCGLPESQPHDCSALVGNTDGLGAVNLKKVAHTGPLQEYGQPNGQGTERVFLPAAGEVILVQTLTTMYVMRIQSVDSGSLTYEWAEAWRDACWRPGGLTCTAACSCPGGD